MSVTLELRLAARTKPALFLMLALLPLAVVKAENFSIDLTSINSGGGTSTGGVFSVSGTIGQPSAGHLSGGNFTLDGGFWGIFAAVQTPGSPFLRVVLTSTNTLVVAWPRASASFTLQQNSAPNTAEWSAVGNPVTTVGEEKQVIIFPLTGNRFFRLKSSQ